MGRRRGQSDWIDFNHALSQRRLDVDNFCGTGKRLEVPCDTCAGRDSPSSVLVEKPQISEDGLRYDFLDNAISVLARTSIATPMSLALAYSSGR